VVTTPNKQIEVFSISHAAILTGTKDVEASGAEETFGDFYGVDSGSIAVNMGTFKNTGDDQTKSVWKYVEDADVEIRGGFIPFDLINLIFGATISSSGSGANLRWDIPFLEEAWNNVAPRPVLLRCPSKDSQGNVRDFDLVLYKVNFGPIKLEGFEYKAGVKVTWGGTAVMSTTNEAGNTITRKAIGRLISTAVH
jgi:hypothetical protein